MFQTKKVTEIKALQVLDSRGNPTIKTTVWAGDVYGSSIVPSGASTGKHEALELRDGKKKYFGGMSVLKAIKNVEGPILKRLRGVKAVNQILADRLMVELDGTDNKSNLGANAILSVSLALARLGAKLEGKELFAYMADMYGNSKIHFGVTPLFNVINGGVHADSGLNVQEMMLIPNGKTMSEKVEIGAEIYHTLKTNLHEAGHVVAVGDEGGFAPHFTSHAEGFEALVRAITDAGYKPGKDVRLGFDAASSEFYDPQTKLYNLSLEQKQLKASELISVYQQWAKDFPITLIEDGMAEDDYQGWEQLTEKMKKTILVGDDFFVTQYARLKKGVELGLANAILIKVNQVGTLTETLQAIALAQDSGYKVVISHRSGDTEDSFISDLAVAVNADYIKAGSLARSERLAKYNRLLEIERHFR
ncbi:MAG TPA: phosphopyruvate hydratase [Patescibacteria group bacterium]|nr:phosphopyruvate hydratase [Patescibacteria group bacterium]